MVTASGRQGDRSSPGSCGAGVARRQVVQRRGPRRRSALSRLTTLHRTDGT
ncbi:hypothetical protein FM106_08655 [Brachybacterium faecium]|nr:hypothetical protein FM106_08655 [Brachybacterium faecium]